jgi:hypothetical protein
METSIQNQFGSFFRSILDYLPSLIGGVVIILVGWLIAWIIKRVLIQISAIMHIDRFLKRSRFEADFSKADVRYSLYTLIGNIGFIIVFLIFLDNALLTLRLHILSDLLREGILFLPKVIIAVAIFGTGWLVSSWVQISVFKTLHREEIPRASLISRFIKSILVIFFSSISLVELDVAREIIIIGFATIFITLGGVTLVFTAAGSKNFLKHIENTFNDKETDNRPLK